MENELLINDLTRLVRRMRNEARYNGTVADVLNESADAIEKLLNKYNHVVVYRPGDVRSGGWRMSPWLGLAY